ncbi:MAG TPA: hypothetical protein VGE27_07535 [Gemmatimonas sp.]
MEIFEAITFQRLRREKKVEQFRQTQNAAVVGAGARTIRRVGVILLS